MSLTPQSVLHSPTYETRVRGDARVLIDSSTPNWLATDAAGAAILARFDGQRTLQQIAAAHALAADLDPVRAWQQVDTIARDALRQQFLSEEKVPAVAYTGRAAHLAGRSLSELWIHTNNACNLACRHCLVSSGPDGDRGLPTETLLSVIVAARRLGARRFFLTGGEPFLRKDIVTLIDAILADPAAGIAILTNGLLLTPARLEALRRHDPARLRLQISLDGATADVNDPIRGAGSYDKIVEGIRVAVAAGLSVTVSTTLAETNADDVPEITRLCGALGVPFHHLLWLHKRGRADDAGIDRTPSVARMIEIVRRARAVAAEVGVLLDNDEAIRSRLRYPVGTRRDLASAGVSSLCVYSDGGVYPSAAMANIPALYCGNIGEKSLEEIWRNSDVVRAFAAATVIDKPICRDCPIRFFCGGGDIEHSYFHGGAITAHDPYCDLHLAMFDDAFFDLTASRRAMVNRAAGFSTPVVWTGMGELAVHCADAAVPETVITSRSECVLSFDIDAPRAVVRTFYGAAAETPSDDLCCPIQPETSELSHIPQSVIDRFYGCGSPVNLASIRTGETTVDLGSGAGIDVFIAAKKVGPMGRAIGVDMTPAMLRVAREAQATVAKNLGYDAVAFHEGFLEAIPLPDRSVDLVTSNCVINLSPDKRRVFSEMWRVLRDYGRIVVADIVADRAVPAHQRKDPRLWGECISGALTEEAFLLDLERAGFYGVSILTRTLWKEVDGCRFFSITVRGYKFQKRAGCAYLGQTATYLGPFKGVGDEEGHWFPRGEAVAVCTDTAAKLTHPPYAGMFALAGSNDAPASFQALPDGCDPTAGCC